jgi:hypothetical protein
MLCIKTVKSLSQDELDKLNTLIDTFYNDNTLLQNEIVIYKKMDKDIIGCICVNPKSRQDNMTLVCLLCTRIEYWHMYIEKNLLDTAKNITGTSLIVEVNEDTRWYYEKYGFQHTTDTVMILQK